MKRINKKQGKPFVVGRYFAEREAKSMFSTAFRPLKWWERIPVVRGLVYRYIDYRSHQAHLRSEKRMTLIDISEDALYDDTNL